MKIQPVSFDSEILALGGGIISLTGGGGKTSLMYALGAALAQNGLRVLCTTSTRIYRPSPDESQYILECLDPDEIILPEHPCILTAARPARQGDDPVKLRSFSSSEIEELYQREVADYIIVEADGASGRPLKAPAQHEPVIPPSTRAVVAVIGLCAIGQFFTDTWVFRSAAFSALSGLQPGEIISPAAAARVASLPDGLFKESPKQARCFLFLNQADIAGAQDKAELLAESFYELEKTNPGQRQVPAAVYIGSIRTSGLKCQKVFSPYGPVINS